MRSSSPLSRASSVGFFSFIGNWKSTKPLKQIHAQIIALGLAAGDPVVTKLLLSSFVADWDYSYRILLTLPSAPTSVFNALIRSYASSKDPNRAIRLFSFMLCSGVPPDHLTFPFLVKSCARLSTLNLGSSVHCHIFKHGLEGDIYVQNSVIHMYFSCGCIDSARKMFDEMPVRNLVSWNSLLDGYAKCVDVRSARAMFDLMPEKDVVSWSAMINGYVKAGLYEDALMVFDWMRQGGPEANEVTMVSILCACSHSGSLHLGREMHWYLMSIGLKMGLELSTCLVDMYFKCGSIREALEVFQKIPAHKTDVFIWNAVIGGLAMHGESEGVLQMFAKMRVVGVCPDEITYLGLLSACAHQGLVEKAWMFFQLMEEQGLSPQVEHFACMVDVLGRSGRVDKAFELARTMPMAPTTSLLGALLSACQICGFPEFGEVVGKWLIELEPGHDGRYIGLSNVYAASRRWRDAESTREFMDKRGVKKVPGYSLMDGEGAFSRFIAHDRVHPQSDDIYLMLVLLVNQMRPQLFNIIDEYHIYEIEGG